MKKLIYFTSVLLIMVTLLQSCAKESASAIVAAPDNAINATITSNDTYQLNFNSAQVSISQQAAHFKMSKIESVSENGSIVYKYAPAADFTGTDQVILSVKNAIITNSAGCYNNRNSNGDDLSYSLSSTTIKLNVVK